MLRIYFGSLPDEIYNTKMYYENKYDKNWVMDDFARKVINDIDVPLAQAGRRAEIERTTLTVYARKRALDFAVRLVV